MSLFLKSVLQFCYFLVDLSVKALNVFFIFS